ncbi:hypothetical protein [Streptomyces achromogenes]|uniref:hypothetical protein n=1 Tax=Streptomyces achromogenes TaxID=67255 RepID=UPI0036B23EEC
MFPPPTPRPFFVVDFDSPSTSTSSPRPPAWLTRKDSDARLTVTEVPPPRQTWLTDDQGHR